MQTINTTVTFQSRQIEAFNILLKYNGRVTMG